MTANTGATPLFALEAIAIDLETTGLDAARAHIVQIGTVAISRSRLREDQARECLVDPGLPIPADSTAIHGIDDAAVAGAPALTAVWDDLIRELDGRVLIGHTVGFDLSVLANEARRRQLPWDKPRALCVRMLAAVAAPSLASHSLDALASWLGLETRNRHRALGDAEAAGLIFIALLPHLEARGIRTLAEAERACRRLGGELERQQSAGWETPVGEPRDEVLGSFDTYPYRHRVGDIMGHPPVVVPPDTTLKAAIDLMVARTISSVFVTATGQPGLDVAEYAIVTERDAMRRIAAGGAAALDETVGAIGSRPLVTIRENAFLYRAVGRMGRVGSRHLGVRSDSDALVGVVSARDLLKLRAGPAIALADAIEQAGTTTDLALAWSTLPVVVRSLLAEAVDAHLVCQIVSEEIRSMTRRATVLAADAMRAAGRGEAPCRYAVLVLGSGGRGESLLVPDQDNAIVFEGGEPDGPEDRWFAELGERLATILDGAGIPYCDGGVMASNAEWRGSLAVWTDRVDRWVRQSRPQDLLNVDIFFDAAPVCGALGLGHNLFVHAYAGGRESPTFAKLLGERLASPAYPVTMFGAIKTRDGRLDLKQHILFPVASAARVLAIRHGVVERSTGRRIGGLVARGIGSEGDLTALLEAHALAVSLTLGQQSRDIAAGLKPSRMVDLAPLSRKQRSDLKRALGRIQDIPTLLRDLMF
ncbi:MAG: DUF294 nucleotidyltransferase-like domain-containing protein [Thalassobaculum sp.]|uniref:DUF294 nucleotidyltransferase-like domain-containing protein n=1 Tax=Thalassobaculum sp. TaxID=2022740 RepID=UPI0032EBC653